MFRIIHFKYSSKTFVCRKYCADNKKNGKQNQRKTTEIKKFMEEKKEV